MHVLRNGETWLHLEEQYMDKKADQSGAVLQMDTVSQYRHVCDLPVVQSFDKRRFSKSINIFVPKY